VINNEKRVTVYVAGPYSSNPDACTAKALKCGNELRNLGMYPFVPHLFHFWERMVVRNYEDWFDMDLLWLSKCDCLVRIPGPSSGADREVAFCEKNGIPVFHSAQEAASVMLPKAMGRIFCIVGPSGVGKTTVQNELMACGHVEDIAISTTTRDMREGERFGVDYNFVSDLDFIESSLNGEFIEEVHFYDNKYGLRRDEFVTAVAGGDVVVVVNASGLKDLTDEFGKENVFGILLVPPSIRELKKRVSARGGDQESINNRAELAIAETQIAEVFDLVVVNDDLDTAVETIGKFIRGRAVRIEVEDE
jgi:guanylate kinase